MKHPMRRPLTSRSLRLLNELIALHNVARNGPSTVPADSIDAYAPLYLSDSASSALSASRQLYINQSHRFSLVPTAANVCHIADSLILGWRVSKPLVRFTSTTSLHQCP